MKPYQVTFSKPAEKGSLRSPKKIGSQILAKIDLQAVNPRPSGSMKLTGSVNSYRLRIADLYTIADKELLLDIIKIVDRKEVNR